MKKVFHKVEYTDDTHRYKELQLHKAQVKSCLCVTNIIKETDGGQDAKDPVYHEAMKYGTHSQSKPIYEIARCDQST